MGEILQRPFEPCRTDNSNQVRVFPRLSIDNSRRVRQLTHILNGHVCSKSGKRTAPHMPRIAGPWLAGLFDSDRAGAKAASDALHLVFNTPEKVYGVRKAFQRPILEYCRDAALYETIQTLSDPRTVNPDDAEATYARVVATSLTVISSLLHELEPADLEKEISVYEEILSEPKLWEFVNHPDTGVRRSMHRFIQAVLDRRSTLLQPHTQAISTAYVDKGLHSGQTGSALDYISTLESLTTFMPSIWTDAYTGKKSAVSRLRHFVKQGSQSASADFWISLDRLLSSIPATVMPSDPKDISDLLSAARTGVSRREERQNASTAWPTYLDFASLLTSPLQQAEAEAVLDSHVLPLVREYLHPQSETAEWSIAGAHATAVLPKVLKITKALPLIQTEWPIQAEKLLELARVSQPEQSKDFKKSQDHVAACGARWAGLQKLFWSDASGHGLQQCFIAVSNTALETCIGLLRSRNGKPYGAAGIVDHLLHTCGKQVMQDKAFREAYLEFAADDLPDMMSTPAQAHLVHGLYAISSDTKFPAAFTRLLSSILDAAEDGATKLDALRVVFIASTPSEAVAAAKGSQPLQDFFIRSSADETQGNFGALFADLVKLGVLTDSTSDRVLSRLTQSLTTVNHAATALPVIGLLQQSSPRTVTKFMSKHDGPGSELIPNLLRLEQSPDDSVADKAHELSAKLSSSVNGSPVQSRYQVVLQHLEQISPASLPIDAVMELANRLIGPDQKSTHISDLLPSLNVWILAVKSVVRAPNAALALTSPFGGAVHFLHNPSVSSKAVQFDTEGLSQSLRISVYIAKFLSSPGALEQLGEEKSMILALLRTMVYIAEDNVSIPGTNDVWNARHNTQAEDTALEFITDANKLLSGHDADVTLTLDSDAPDFTALERLREGEDALSPMSYYTWLAYAQSMTNAFEVHGFSSTQSQEGEKVLEERISQKQLLPLIACVLGLRQPLTSSQRLNKWCNGLISDLTSVDTLHEQKALEQLILLNTILDTQEEITTGIAKQRLVFLLKAMTQWLGKSLLGGHGETVSTALKTEMFKAMAKLLPAMHDLYGEHWEEVLTALIACWSTDLTTDNETPISGENIVLMNGTLKLLGTLRRMAKSEDANDDLVEALQKEDEQIRRELIRLLLEANGNHDEANQPLLITHELLARQLASLPYKPVQQADELYTLLNSASRPVMEAGFGLLHQHIPAAQEQISFDAALENKTAQLPDELLSLILEAPTLDSLADASFDRMMPLSLQGYLFSWRLVFDHFVGSSFRVRSDYIEQLKGDGYLTGLLDLTFDLLGHTTGKPTDVSRFDLQTYVADVEPSPEKDVQWLLAHLYFLALSHLPNLVKTYYLNLTSRQTPPAIESWTAKYFSPLLVNAALESVAEWSEKTVKTDAEYEHMTVKVGMRSKEVHIGYLVDEQTMAIKVILPDAYPLASAQVVGINRVAVKEEKWQSWLRGCQGVITFSVSLTYTPPSSSPPDPNPLSPLLQNGSIIDGLTAWHKNVVGALKGHTECAICYSIISAAKELPAKRCMTCKNIFHASCLFKWFRTSNASTCPLCRTQFSYN